MSIPIYLPRELGAVEVVVAEMMRAYFPQLHPMSTIVQTIVIHDLDQTKNHEISRTDQIPGLIVEQLISHPTRTTKMVRR